MGENISLTFAPKFDGGVELSPALFGLAHYDEPVTGRLVYPKDNVGCTPVKLEEMDNWPVQDPLVALVDRGVCAFEQKVWHMQNAGAKAVIIVDDMVEAKLPYLAAAHSTGDILIPSVIIKKKMGDKLKAYMCSCAGTSGKDTKTNFMVHRVDATLDFGLPNPDDEVEWTLWTSADDMRTVGFKREFASAFRALSAQTKFNVRYFIRSGIAIGCFHGRMDNKQCDNQCTNGGRYCAPDPDSDSFYGLDGRDIVVENLRQLCVFNVTSRTNEQWKWWKYVTAANQECGQFKILPDADKCKRASVTDNLMTQLGISPGAVKQCMADSGGIFDDKENTLLQKQLAAQVDDNVFVQPTIIINGVQYRGNLECPNTNNLRHCSVLSAICAGFSPDKAPDVCREDTPEWHFKMQDTKLEWAGAEMACQRQGFGAHLAILSAENDNDRIFAQCGAKRCWIGLDDRTSEGTFKWTDGTALLPKDAKAHWAPGEPNNGGFDKDMPGQDEDCGYIHGRTYGTRTKQSLWGDHKCTEKMPFVCRLPVVRRYQFYASKASWEKAEASCVAKGGHLADIQSIKANANVDAQCEAERCWIGLNDRATEGAYRWTDGVVVGTSSAWKGPTIAGKKKPFVNWAAGEPNNGGFATRNVEGEQCGYIHGIQYPDKKKRGKWGDHKCREEMPYVCSFPDTIAQTSELPMPDWRASANIPGTTTKPKTTDVFVSVTSPEDLASSFRDGIPLRPALFGVPPYGGHIAGRLVYVSHKISDHGCEQFSMSKIRDMNGKREWSAHEAVILMVNRGQCMFTDKVRHGQQAGAAAVIVVDDTQTVNLPFMQAGGSGRGITIPSMIIHREDGFRLQQYMCGNTGGLSDATKCGDDADFLRKRVEIKISWDVPKPTGTTNWHWWTSSADPFSTSLKMQFGSWMSQLGKKAELTLHYAVQSGEDIGCYGPGVSSSKGGAGKPGVATKHAQRCAKQCTNKGRYCALDWPMADKFVLEENLRQLCIFRSTLDNQGKGNVLVIEGPSSTANKKWWQYITAFEKQCNVRGFVPGQQCFSKPEKSYAIMKSVGIDVAAIKKCEQASGGTTNDVANSIFDQQLKARLEEGAFMTPTISVNGQKYLGNLECTVNQRAEYSVSFRNGPDTAPFSSCGILGEICAGFTKKSLPELCSKAINAPVPKGASKPLHTLTLSPRKAPGQALTGSSTYIPSTDRALTLSIVAPDDLKEKFSSRGIMARPSLFGIPTYYGGVLSGQLRWGSGEGNRNGCKAYAKPLPKATTTIVLVDRGGCTFVVKVRNAMKAGAAAVLIADNSPQNILIYAGATGSTDDIIIPSAFIHMNDAVLLKTALCEMKDANRCHLGNVRNLDFWDPKGVKFDSQVSLQFQWSLPKPKETVHWKLWLSSVGSGTVSNNASIAFLSQFQTAALALGSHAELDVRYQVTSGRGLSCLPHFGTKECTGLCTNGGRYCASDPDGKLKQGLSGRDVVVEDLRQLCVFNVSKQKGQLHMWWEYVNAFNRKCKPGIGNSWEKHCRKETKLLDGIMRDAGLEPRDVAACMKNSGGTDADKPNSLLEEQVRAKQDDGVVNLQITTVMINGVKFRGNLGCSDPYDLNKCGVLAAMCQAFAPPVAPALCGGGVSAYSFRHFTVKRSWDAAEKICQRHGGHLARIRSLTDQQRVYAACGGLTGTTEGGGKGAGAPRCWIGLNDKQTEGKYQWADGSDPGFYRLWAPGEPNNGGTSGVEENCAYMHGPTYPDPDKRKRWGDHPCSDKMDFVCEIPIDFVLNAQKLDWQRAEAACKEQGGHLANIQSFGDNMKVYDACEADRCWIGLNDRATEGNYVWTDGMKLGKAEGDSKSSFVMWAPGEPSETVLPGNSIDKDEKCVYMHGSTYSPISKKRHWGDHACSLTSASICELQAEFYFTYYPTPTAWQQAEAACVKHDGHLARIDSVSMNTRVWDACKGERCWLGLNDREHENRFVWTDGITLGARAFQPWAPGEPNNGGSSGVEEDCVYVHGNQYHPYEKQRTWGDHPCSQKLPFVCQHRIRAGRDKHTSPPSASPASSSSSSSSSSRYSRSKSSAPVARTPWPTRAPRKAPAPAPSRSSSSSSSGKTATTRVRAFLTLRGDGKDFALFGPSLQLGFRKCVVDVLQLEGVALDDVSIKIYDRKPARRRRLIGAVEAVGAVRAGGSGGNSLVTLGLLVLAQSFEDAQQVKQDLEQWVEPKSVGDFRQVLAGEGFKQGWGIYVVKDTLRVEIDASGASLPAQYGVRTSASVNPDGTPKSSGSSGGGQIVVGKGQGSSMFGSLVGFVLLLVLVVGLLVAAVQKGFVDQETVVGTLRETGRIAASSARALMTMAQEAMGKPSSRHNQDYSLVDMDGDATGIANRVQGTPESGGAPNSGGGGGGFGGSAATLFGGGGGGGGAAQQVGELPAGGDTGYMPPTQPTEQPGTFDSHNDL